MHGLTMLAIMAGAIAPAFGHAQENSAPVLKHTHEEFSLIVRAPYEQAFPLFGAWEEKKWAEGFDPQFVYPIPPRDQEGMVFRVQHKHMSSVWTNTAFDLTTGHVQYVYVVNDAMVCLIDIHLARASAAETKVSVVYERTALTPEANEHVEQMAKSDATSGPEWANAINGYLQPTTATGQPK
jgi:hypothetical protein